MVDSYLKSNGTSQNILVADDIALNFGISNFSISFWAKTTDVHGAFIAKGTTAYYAIVNEGAGILRVRLFDGTNTVNINSTHTPVDSNFHFYCFTADRAGLGSFYIDNNLPDTGDITSIGSIDHATTYLVIGAGLACSIDDIRLYKNKILSVAEKNYIYNEGRGRKLTGTEDGLSWGSNCDDATGNTLTDITNTVNGTLTGNVLDNMWKAGGVPFALEADTFNAFDSNERWSF